MNTNVGHPRVPPGRGLLFLLLMMLSPLFLLPAFLTHGSTRLGQDTMSLVPLSPWGIMPVLLQLLLAMCFFSYLRVSHKPMRSPRSTMGSLITALKGWAGSMSSEGTLPGHLGPPAHLSLLLLLWTRTFNILHLCPAAQSCGPTQTTASWPPTAACTIGWVQPPRILERSATNRRRSFHLPLATQPALGLVQPGPVRPRSTTEGPVWALHSHRILPHRLGHHAVGLV